MNQVFGYPGVKGGSELIGANGARYILVYNKLASPATMALGACYEILWVDDSTNGYFPTPKIPATESAVVHMCGIVNNFNRPDGTILDGTWGWLQVRGYCENVLATNTIVDNRTLLTTNGATTLTDSTGTAYTTATIGVAKGARTGAGLFPAYLLGNLIAMT